MSGAAMQPIETAPTDGQVFIVVYSDFSGVEAIRYGEFVGGQPSWFLSDYSDEFYPIKDLSSVCAGWFWAPHVPWLDVGLAKAEGRS